MIKGEFRDPVYQIDYIVAGNCARNDALALVGIHEDHDSEAGAFFDGETALIYVKNITLEPVTFGSIAHEAFHVVNEVLQNAGMKPPEEDNDEAYAYYLDFIVSKCVEILMEDIL